MQIVLIILIAIIVIGLSLLFYALAEPHMLRTTDNNLGECNNSNSINVAFFSDLHAEMCLISQERLINELSKKHKVTGIDVVVFGGDICNNPSKCNKGITYLKSIAEFCNMNNIPFAGVNGNHDILLSEETISKGGFIDLYKSPLTINKNGNSYTFYGSRDTGRKNRDWTKVNYASSDDTKILVSHNPDIILHLPEDKKYDYILSGHIHGGQIRTPFRIEFTVLRKDELPKMGIHSGTHTISDTSIFISKGLGCILMPLRLIAKPELNFIKIQSKK